MMSNIVWIKVLDRFPEENYEVLISDGKFVHEAVLSKDKWWSTDSQNPYNFNNVSYWMEKPITPNTYADYCDYPHDHLEYERYLGKKAIYNIYDWEKMMSIKSKEKIQSKMKIIKCDGAIIEELSENSLMIYHRNGDGMEIGKSPMANLIDEYINHNI